MYKVEKNSEGKWAVKKDGAKRASKTFDDEKSAKEYAKKMNSTTETTSTSSKKMNSSKITTTKVKKSAKKIWVWILALLGIGAVGTGGAVVATQVVNSNNSADAVTGVVYDDFQIHFMTLGNDKAGDSVYIKAGDTDILIDAGSRSNSATTTLAYMDKYVKDGKLEYVIATHGDQDHVEAFPNILNHFSAGTIIMNSYTSKTTSTYTKMLTAFQNQVDTNGAKLLYAGDCYNNAGNGAQRSYKLSDNVTMNILYNKYYYEKGYTSSTVPSGWENNYSVCTLFTYTKGDEVKNFMLTGDLELEGEEAMAAYYDGSTAEKTLPTVDLFKAGHHGSKTSSNDCLLNIIQPKMCVVSCCCGTNEYTENTDNQFPTQAFIDRISKWTDAVYVTSIYESFTIETNSSTGKQYISSTGRKDMNGNIIVSCGTDEDSTLQVGLACSNNTTKLKDSEWMNTKVTLDGVERYVRTMPNAWKSTEA